MTSFPSAATRLSAIVWRMRVSMKAMDLMCSSKKGFSANQFSRILGVDIKTGWFIGHRIREMMDESGSGPLGGEGKVVEVDETFQGYVEGGPTLDLASRARLAAPARLSHHTQHPHPPCPLTPRTTR